MALERFRRAGPVDPPPPLGFAPTDDRHPYAGARAVLATKHDKLDLVAPPLRDEVGLEVLATQVDTDLLGTFTPERERRLPPLDAAIAKARMGMEATGERIGLASEGSIGPDPDFPLLLSDRELVVLVDDHLGIVISASARSYRVVAERGVFGPGDDLVDFLARASFPDHKLVVMPNRSRRRIRPIKGVGDLDELCAAIGESSRSSRDSRARVESDLRASANPTRRAVIAAAAAALAKRVAGLCPSCSAPGWGEAERWTVRRCTRCSALQRRAEPVWSCVSCPAIAPVESADQLGTLCDACLRAELAGG